MIHTTKNKGEMPAQSQSSAIEQSVKRCEELTAVFNQRDIFSNDVNLTRARTLAIAADSSSGGATRKKNSSSPAPHMFSTSVLGKSSMSAKSHHTNHSAALMGNMSGGEKASKIPIGMQALQNRLLEVEEASATAQARGSSVDAELSKIRAQIYEKEGANGGGAPSPPVPAHRRNNNAKTNGGGAGKYATTNNSSNNNNSRHAAGGGASAVMAQMKQYGHSSSPAPYPTAETPIGYRASSDGSSRRLDGVDHSSVQNSRIQESHVQMLGKVPEPVERGTLAPSEWFQKSTEHLEYPEAEKETRQHFKKRDELKRGVTPVERYTVPFTTKMTEKERAWQEGSAKVSISIIHPDPLAALRKSSSQPAKPKDDGDDEPQPPRVVNGKSRMISPTDRAVSPIQKRQRPPPPATSKPSAAKKSSVASPSGGDEPAADNFEKMQDRDQFIRLARSSRQARKVYESSIAKELLAAANMLGPHVPLFANQPRKQKRTKPQLDDGSGDEGSFLKRPDDDEDDEDAQSQLSFSSSDSEEMCEDSHMEAEREGIRHLGDDDSAPQIPGLRGFTSDEKTNDLQDTCDLVECCVVCLCQQLSGSRSAITREQVILRSILIHALHTALPPLEDELSRRLAFINKKVSVPPAQRRTDAALISRLLRSWVKGIEVLLTLDMGTINEEGIPFSVHNEGHLSRMIQNYCRLHEGKDDRVQRLFERWRANKEEADSAIIRNDTAKLLKPPPPQQSKALDIVNHFRNVAAVTTDDLALLDHQTATVTAKQRDLAQVFLDRITKFLPLPDESKTIAQRRVEQVAEFTEADLMLRHQPPNLKHVLLHYTGLLRHAQHLSTTNSLVQPSTNSTAGASVPSQHLLATPAAGNGSAESFSLLQQNSTNFSFGAANVSTAGVTKFLNVFRTSWGRTPLTGEVEESEAADRATTMQNNTMIMLFDAYFRLLSPLLQERVKLLVRDEKKRSAELRAKMKADAEAFHRALDEIGHVVKADPQMEARKEALHQVERYQLIDKYTVSKIDPSTSDKLRKSIESSEAWFGYETSRRAARAAAANPQNDDSTWNDDAESDKQANNNNRGSPAGGTSRMEMIRIRKLQELEACWQKLNIGYSLRVTLHDKWNHPTKELRHIDTALKLYRDCIAAVELREAAVAKVIDNEKCNDKTERNANRNELFSTMCSAGQRCELVAKKLFNDTGDELFVKSDMYLAKIRDDFTRISKMIRSTT
ncbi:Hypothetical protein, putative [Bodo saltans]|uniref:Uncharacterized protein n=1 Tax=Bodo saltans TaxID=75058 RepID=A0A0S4JIB7_BODSA|nr:Hypothetical protein, putative [Bodo saltans]|eukprot:CUG89920.1 Hypothetical protein, putative [Bodo saltans]